MPTTKEWNSGSPEKVERNWRIVFDRYPNFPATGTIGMTPTELERKYGIDDWFITKIIRRYVKKYL